MRINKIDIKVKFNNGNIITYHCFRISITRKSIWLYFNHNYEKVTFNRLNLDHIDCFDILHFEDY